MAMTPLEFNKSQLLIRREYRKKHGMIGRWRLKYRKTELADGTKVYYPPQDKIWNPIFIETMTVYSNNEEN